MGFFVFYDISDSASFDNVKRWIGEIGKITVIFCMFT